MSVLQEFREFAIKGNVVLVLLLSMDDELYLA